MLSEAKKAKKKGGKDVTHSIICAMMKLSKAILKHQGSSKKKAKAEKPKGTEPVSQVESVQYKSSYVRKLMETAPWKYCRRMQALL